MDHVKNCIFCRASAFWLVVLYIDNKKTHNLIKWKDIKGKCKVCSDLVLITMIPLGGKIAH